MTIVSLDRLLRGGRFVGSRGSKSRLGEFARICRRRRSCDSFPNRPYGQRMLSCPRGNEGMSETRKSWIVSIPGTTKLHRLEENLGAAAIELTADYLRDIDA